MANVLKDILSSFCRTLFYGDHCPYVPSPATARDGQTPDDPLNSRTCPRRYLVELARTHPEKKLDFGLVNRENPIMNPTTPGIDDEAWQGGAGLGFGFGV